MKYRMDKCKEVKDYPTILNVLGAINRQVIRPKIEAMLDNFEKIHNISTNKIDNDEPVGTGTTNNNK